MTRKWTNRLVECMYEGSITAEEIVNMAVNYMSEADVEDMCRVNDVDLFPDEDDSEHVAV